MTEPIECNLPWERIPTCGCDPGKGPLPTKQQRLECELRGGPCSPRYNELHPEGQIPSDAI